MEIGKRGDMADKIKGDMYIMEIKDWKTSELVEFLCSYNRYEIYTFYTSSPKTKVLQWR